MYDEYLLICAASADHIDVFEEFVRKTLLILLPTIITLCTSQVLIWGVSLLKDSGLHTFESGMV